MVVYDKGKADGVLQERLGAERLWIALKPIWPEDRPHLPLAEIADWFASYVYLPRLRDRVVLETTIRDAVAKLDPEFGYADSYDGATGRYRNLVWGQEPARAAAGDRGAGACCGGESAVGREHDEAASGDA